MNVDPWLALVATQLQILKSCAFFPEQVSWLSNNSTLFKISLFNCTIGVASQRDRRCQISTSSARSSIPFVKSISCRCKIDFSLALILGGEIA